MLEFQGKRAKLYNKLAWATEPSFIDAVVSAGKIRPTDTVLDVGIGTGIMTDAIAPLVHKVVGIDVSREMLDLGTKHDNVKLVEGDIRESGLRSKSFDRIVARQVFHHILSDMSRATKECYRLLKPGGLMILAEGIPPTQEATTFYKKTFALKEERIVFSERDLVSLLGRHNFLDVTLTCIWQRQSSVRNWLSNSNLAKGVQDKIFRMFLDDRILCEKAYNMTMHDDDCFIDMKQAIVVGRKGK